MTTAHIDLIALYRSFVANAAPGESRLEVSGFTGEEFVKLVWDGPDSIRWSYYFTLRLFDQYAGSYEVGRWLAGKLHDELSKAKP